jgi:hypothetical protein
MHGRKHSLDLIWPRALRKCIFNFTVLKMFEFFCVIENFLLIFVGKFSCLLYFLRSIPTFILVFNRISVLLCKILTFAANKLPLIFYVIELNAYIASNVICLISNNLSQTMFVLD